MAGHYEMDRDDMELARDMLYQQLGWDKAMGTPTRETLAALGMEDVENP